MSIGKPLKPIPDDYIEPSPDSREIEELAALWDQYAPKQYQGIILAKPIEDRAEIKALWYWDQATREYVNGKTGRRVPVRDLQTATREFTKAYLGI